MMENKRYKFTAYYRANFMILKEDEVNERIAVVLT